VTGLLLRSRSGRTGVVLSQLKREERETLNPSEHVYEILPRNDIRRVDLISDVLPFRRL
jgi:hypothetical protein